MSFYRRVLPPGFASVALATSREGFVPSVWRSTAGCHGNIALNDIVVVRKQTTIFSIESSVVNFESYLDRSPPQQL
jgi:hypothetical protein